MAGAAARSITSVSMPCRCSSSRATARPAGPAPMTTASLLSWGCAVIVIFLFLAVGEAGLSRQRTDLLVAAKQRERGLHGVGEPGGLADRCAMVRRHVDMRAPQVPGECPLQPGWHPPVLGQHDDGASYRWRRCIAHVELHQLPCGTPQLGRSDVGCAGGAHDFATSYAGSVSQQFAAANRC